MDYRFKESVNVIRFPEERIEENRGYKDCCEAQLKLASSTDTDSYKNDLIGVFVKISDVSDTVNFVISRCDDGLPLPNLGDVLNAPQDALLQGFIFDCRQYLITYGRGKYNVDIEYTISGVTGSVRWGQYDLEEFSISRAAGTVRIRSKFQSKYQKLNADFTDSNFEDTIRFNGFFGEIQPKTEINNLINKGRISEKITRENLNEYTLKTDPISYTLSSQIILALLNENELYISDHNAGNHNYFLFDVPVQLIETPELEYYRRGRPAKMVVKFGDRRLIDKTYYNKQ